MAVTKAKKTEQVEKLSKDLKKVSSMIVATYSKLTVAQDYELRKAVRSAGAKYRVVKNTLAERAAKGTKVEDALKDLTGVTSIAYTRAIRSPWPRRSPSTPRTPGVHLQGRRGRRPRDLDQGDRGAGHMPSKEELYSKLLFLINAPAQRLVTVMNAVGRDLAVVIDQGVREEKVQGSISEHLVIGQAS